LARQTPVTRVIAHRGLHAQVRENTVSAFEAALAAGVDGVELDVRSTRDGLLVVHHDPAVDGEVISETLGADLPTHVASLAEAILACGDLEVNVELKMDAYGPDDERRAPFIDRVLAQVNSLGAASRVTYSSFDAGACAALVGRQAESPVGLLLDWDEDVEAAIAAAVAMRCQALHPYFATVNEWVISAAHGAGLAVNVWTPNARDDLARMIGVGVDAVITDDPVLAIELRGL
jgi:glycerophosphoryl diester phosphodiesterase